MVDSSSWPFFADFLVELETAAGPAALGEALQAVEEKTGLDARSEDPPAYPNFVEGFPGVGCSDSVNPDDHSDWSRAGKEAERRFGYFGRIWTWASSPCAVWEGFDADRYLGPFDRDTANPVLVVANRFDPATPYTGAQVVRGLLPDSSLLTVEGWGHTSLFLSLCADRVVSQYLLDKRVDPNGMTCAQDVGPFDASSALSVDDRLLERQRARAEVMSEIAAPRGR